MIRAVLVVALMATLGGCYSVRHRNDDGGTAATADKPAPEAKTAKKKEAKEVLPAGLGGDKEHHAYTDSPQ